MLAVERFQYNGLLLERYRLPYIQQATNSSSNVLDSSVMMYR
jgi:hypothetical protein